jgi:transcription elongation factor Elf1
MTGWKPPPPAPKLARQFTCPQCQTKVALGYEPDFHGHMVPTLFECPACGAGCAADLPGRLKEISRMEPEM